LSFRLKSILGVALIEAVVLSVLIYEAYSLVSNSNAQAIEYRARVAAEQFSAATKNAVLVHDLGTLETFTAQILDPDGVVYARIIDRSNQVIAQSGQSDVLQRPFVADLSVFDVSDGTYDVEAEINEGGLLYGKVHLGISTEKFDSILATAKQRTLSIAILEIVLVALFSFVLGGYLIRQLRTLRDGANRLSKGEQGVLVQITGKDEIAETAISFNQISTNLDQSHQENAEQSELLKDLLYTSSDFFWQTDEKLRIRYLSVDYIPSLGLDTKNLMGLTLWDFLASQRYSNNMHVDYVKSMLVERREFSEVELEIKSNKDEKRWFSLSGKPAYNADQEFIEYRGTGKDITEFFVKELQLKEARELAEASNEAKSAFLATMSHELRTPLNAILGLSSVLKETRLDKDQAEILGHIISGGETLFKSLSDIMDILNVDSNVDVLNLEPFSLTSFLEQMTYQFRDEAIKNGNELTYSVDPERSLILMGDIARLTRILRNLMSNAVKFCRNGKVNINARFESRENFETFLVVTVQDNGLGIAEDYQETVFNAFTQIDSSITREFGGTGLGLNIVKQLVTLMNGSVGLESKPQTGSTFWFEIPIQEVVSDVSVSLD
jgi:PAS domain S-box-containing protein